MKCVKRCFISLLALAMMIPAGGLASAADTETVITLADTGVKVNGAPVSEKTGEDVYLSQKIETHEDVPASLAGLENQVITITRAGTYRVTGTMTDAQLAVSAAASDEVTIILDHADITCRTAPAIMVYTAYEPAEPGKSGVTLYLAEGSKNVITGSHTLKTEADDVKHDAAISSNVSLTIDGGGALEVVGDNEGIEVKYKHLTINDGNIRIDSCDDPLNASEDGVAHITMNGGTVYCIAERGAEGDGIDSNGYITINGGTVIALASPNSMDSGLDSDMGTTINGGLVVGAGNMYDVLENTGDQLFMYLQFAAATDDVICITDAADQPIFAYDFPHDYSYISLSSPVLQEGTYHVYIGGTVTGTVSDGLYTSIDSFSGGTQMRHGGTAAMDNGSWGDTRRPGRQNSGQDSDLDTPPEDPAASRGGEAWTQLAQNGGIVPEKDGERGPDREAGQPPQLPDGMAWPQKPDGLLGNPGGMDRPGGFGGGPGGMQSSGEEISYDFVLTRESRSFTNVSTGEAQESAGFSDVTPDAWFYASVTRALEEGWIIGVGDHRFAPEEQVTGGEWITILARLAGVSLQAGEPWYTGAAAWGAEHGIIDESSWGFEPEDTLTREQMTDMIWRFARAQGMDMEKTADLSQYVDSGIISDYAAEAFAWTVAAGILQGDGTALLPGDNLSRAEAAEAAVKLKAVMDNSAQNKKTDADIYPVSVSKALYTPFSERAEGYFEDGFQTGFGSGVTFKGYDAEGNPQFYGITDRGPSLDVPSADGTVTDAKKIFPSPAFTPSIGLITLKDGEAVVDEAIRLKNTDGIPLTGLPLPAGSLGATGEVPLDIHLEPLDYDSNGFDPEGIAVDAEGNFWVADEYGPYIAKFSADGTMLEKFAPGDGLPEILQYRIANRGFEGISAAPSGKIFATLQSVLDIDGETSKTATFIRILQLDPKTGETKMYAYPVELSDYASPKNCKIGDVFAIDDNTLLVVEQGKLADGTMRNIIYQVDLTGATDLSNLEYQGKALEYTADRTALEAMMQYTEKRVYVDLRRLGWTAEKAEGLCLMEDGTLAVMIEDDFGLAGAELRKGADTVTLVPNTGGDAAQMWLIEV